jgi:HSP20 family protein
MTTSEKTSIEKKESHPFLPMRRHIDDIFEDFRNEMESMFRSWRFPVFAELEKEIRLPVCDMVDKGDKYELQLEVPGIDKDKVDVKATKNSLEISAQQEEKIEEKKKKYVYNERSYRSFHRRIPIPDEILPSKIDAKMNNGILQIQLPKKIPTKAEEETTKVEIK